MGGPAAEVFGRGGGGGGGEGGDAGAGDPADVDTVGVRDGAFFLVRCSALREVAAACVGIEDNPGKYCCTSSAGISLITLACCGDFGPDGAGGGGGGACVKLSSSSQCHSSDASQYK